MNVIHLCPNTTRDEDARLTLSLCKAHRPGKQPYLIITPQSMTDAKEVYGGIH